MRVFIFCILNIITYVFSKDIGFTNENSNLESKYFVLSKNEVQSYDSIELLKTNEELVQQFKRDVDLESQTQDRDEPTDKPVKDEFSGDLVTVTHTLLFDKTIFVTKTVCYVDTLVLSGEECHTTPECEPTTESTDEECIDDGPTDDECIDESTHDECIDDEPTDECVESTTSECECVEPTTSECVESSTTECAAPTLVPVKTEEPTESKTEEPTESKTEEPTESKTKESSESKTEEPTESVKSEETLVPAKTVEEETKSSSDSSEDQCSVTTTVTVTNRFGEVVTTTVTLIINDTNDTLSKDKLEKGDGIRLEGFRKIGLIYIATGIVIGVWAII